MGSPVQNSSYLQYRHPTLIEHSLALQKRRRLLKNSMIWGLANAGLLTALVYDLSDSCFFYPTYYEYFKYVLLFILIANLLYHSFKIFLNLKFEQIPITRTQKLILGIADDDPNYKIVDSWEMTLPFKPLQTPNKSPIQNVSQTPMNMTAQSWRSNDSMNYSLQSQSWCYHKSTPPRPTGPETSPTIMSTPKDTSGIDFIKDENDLDVYLKNFESNTNTSNLTNKTNLSTNLLSTFWNHPVTKTARDMTAVLKNCQYQLASQSPVKSSTGSPKGKIESKSPANEQTSALIAWTRMNVDIIALTRWHENLRKWISETILDRLVKESDLINETLEKHGMSDIKIGQVGLDRLRKTAQSSHITNMIPSLSTIIPFLEVSSNQEYVVKRIRELSRGGCVSEFRWNAGSSYNGKEWDSSLPTDSEIIMHLLASYLDTQLMPLPSMPNAKPFSGLYFIKYKEKMPNLTSNSLFIQQVSNKPPHYRVVVGETIYEMIKGYNNLFHCILFFLYNVYKREYGVLGRVDLGRGGVNMLWIIDQ